MDSRDLLITEDGKCHLCDLASETEDSTRQYRLYRFLTDLEDILEAETDEGKRLNRIRPLVRRLLTSSYWLQGEYVEPDPVKGWSVLMLYDEPDFPLTVQTVVWLPGRSSSIHNHATWGVVALISGQEKNIFWQRAGDREFPERLEKTGECTLVPGDIISFMPEAIHSVEILGDEPSITFNIYGKTEYQKRFEFDLTTHTATNF
ncbi:MAG: cupin [Symploca sp. SIO3C6]|uniref:Cupin n=1 Tax=Symploca sp. SIO1C4 TaxID=2607765 RepID=A0A6B3NA55_9CYAN|nr:cupin [Symploca sp. SIO3C6]NER28537.1 cupin [Symploca sp. SIO1C4]NET07098.1 cupin [Symploca sp. SIO2B6]